MKQLDMIAEVVGQQIGEAYKRLDARIGALEKRPELRHADTYAESKTYHMGNLVTLNGGLWLCKRRTSVRPGQSSSWQLICKSGTAT